MREYILVSLVVLWATAAPSASLLDGAGQESVEVKHVVKVFIAKTKPAYSVHFEYRFPGRSTVHIRNLGIAPPSGSFRYLTTDKALNFHDSTSGELLRSVPLRETVQVAAKPPLNELAAETDFSPAYRSYRWASHESLLQRTNAVLAKYFRYRPYERDGRTYLITTFAPLELGGVREGILGQVAVLISFPYEAEAAHYSFRVHSLVREGRSHSDQFRLTSNRELAAAADVFLSGLVTEIERGS